MDGLAPSQGRLAPSEAACRGMPGTACSEPLASAAGSHHRLRETPVPFCHELLGQMLDLLAHRGPDDAGRYVAEGVALGHRRLSIIDLETGRQPLANEDQTVWAVVNGEFYNFVELREELTARGHRFRSAGDSECLVHLYEEYGPNCVDRLHGMFAFAVWDAARRTLLLARDRLGVKPLYYCLDGTLLAFASELKALLALPCIPFDIDATALVDYFTYSFIPSPKTIFENVAKLPPGHLLTFRNGRANLSCYWEPRHRGWRAGSAEEIAEELWETLKQATRPRLIADVPVGAFLSGGLDSSAVVTAISQVAANEINTLTCGFEEQAFDERAYARDVASRLGTAHHEALARPDAAAMIDTLCWHFDEPFADASAVPTYYLSQCARQFVKVVLSGDGGDEALGGYRRYRFDLYEQAARRWLPTWLRRRLLAPLAAVYPSRPWMPRPLRAAATLRNLATDAAAAHGLSIATLHPDAARALFRHEMAAQARDHDPIDHARRLYNRCDAPDHLTRCQYVDIRLGLADGILTKVDRASMAHALEVRSPMLDHRFVEFALSIPAAMRIRGTAGKHPLRMAMAKHLSRRAAGRRKAGFEAPLDDWFLGPLRERFCDELLHPGAALNDYLQPEAIRRIWDDHLARRRLNGPTLWKLAMLEAWLQRFHRRQGCGLTPDTCASRTTFRQANVRASPPPAALPHHDRRIDGNRQGEDGASEPPVPVHPSVQGRYRSSPGDCSCIRGS